MLKKLTIIFLSTLLIVSCAKKEQPKSELDNLPKWVLDPYVKGTIAAVGMSPASTGGLQFQIPKAEADARANIAAQIETVVSRLTKNALREAKLGEQNDAESVFSQATKSLIKEVPLSGARRINMFKDPDDGTLYIHMSIDSDMVINYLNNNQKVLEATISASSMSRSNITKSQEAVRELFTELNEELKK